MKKLLLILTISVLTIAGSHAQIKLGLRGGLNFDKVTLKQDSYERYQIDYNRGMGFHFGLTSQIKILNLFVQPEFLFSTLTNEVTLNDIQQFGYKEVGKQRFNKLDIPIQAGLKFGAFKIGAGPVATMILSSKSDLLDQYEMQHNKATIGYQIGGGFDFDHFNIELRWEGNLSKLGSGVRVGNHIYDFDQRINQVILTSAIYF
jgi:hypothetical protein